LRQTCKRDLLVVGSGTPHASNVAHLSNARSAWPRAVIGGEPIMANFPNAVPELSARYQNKHVHGGNHAPSVADWFKNDDTLDRQGVSHGKPNGHGICKGVASGWVIAFLNKVPDSIDPARFEQFYTDFLRYQGTMIKDFGKHIDSHVAQFSKLGVETNIHQVSQKQIVTLRAKDCPTSSGPFGHRWGAYISCWHHDIACGTRAGKNRLYYIMEPNTGLLGYRSETDFLGDLNAYIAGRRESKGVGDAPAGYWFYQANR
jgi:hypothetical protein